MEITEIVAANLREIRERRKLSLDGVAALTGVSKSMLGQIERGEVNPTISMLWRIANGLKIPFTTLVDSKRSGDLQITRGAEVTPITEEGNPRYRNYPIMPMQPFDSGLRFEIYMVEIDPGGGVESGPHLSGSQEYVTVFSGEVLVTVSGVEHRLSQGDFVRFRCDVPHAYHNPSAEMTRLSMVISYA